MLGHELVSAYEIDMFKAVFAVLYFGCMRIGEAVWASDDSDHALRGNQLFLVSGDRNRLVVLAIHFETFKNAKPAGEQTPPLLVPAESDRRVCQ